MKTPLMAGLFVGVVACVMAISTAQAQTSTKMKMTTEIPVANFWSVILYDSQTRSMLQNDQQWPAVTSQNKAVLINPDGSVDVYFGPKAPAGKENNWVQTIPGKGWNTILRLYGPLQPWFDKTWRPSEIELIK